MRIVFFGTPDYILPVLEKLHKEFKDRSGKSPISAVVTQKPKPVGKKQELAYSAVDTWAYKKQVPIFFDSRELIQNKIEADLGVLASYGEIIPKEVLNYFPQGILNIHPSLLPKYRGASPIQAAIVSGDKETGVTIIKLDGLLDHGPIISQFKDEILDEDTTDSLRRRLFERSAEVLTTLIPTYVSGKIKPHEQNHKEAIFTRQIKKEDGFIPPEYLEACLRGRCLKAAWQIPFIKNCMLPVTNYLLHDFIRTMQPWPIAWTEIKIMANDQWLKRRLKILKAHLEEISNIKYPASPAGGQVSKLVLDEVQLEGKGLVSWKQFLEGYPKAMFE